MDIEWEIEGRLTGVRNKERNVVWNHQFLPEIWSWDRKERKKIPTSCRVRNEEHKKEYDDENKELWIFQQ